MDNKSIMAQAGAAMRWLSYIPGHSTLLLLYKAARVRLMANSTDVGSLSDARIASATEEINQISDDIRDAKSVGSLDHADAALLVSKPADQEVAVPITVAPSAALWSEDSKAPVKPVQVDQVKAVDSAKTEDSVQWRGEHNALAGQREKVAFVSQLVTLGYSPPEFRVTVWRVSSEWPADTQQRYTVLVAQLLNGMPYRGKRYIGGHGAEWVDEFSRGAATDFPHSGDPIPASGAQARTKQ